MGVLRSGVMTMPLHALMPHLPLLMKVVNTALTVGASAHTRWRAMRLCKSVCAMCGHVAAAGVVLRWPHLPHQ